MEKNIITNDTEILMNVNNLADFLFIENYNDIKIKISSDKFKSSKDLFYFFLDLFFKSIVLLYGDNDMTSVPRKYNSVYLNDLSIEQIGFIKDKFKNAYIKLLFEYRYEENTDIIDKYKFSSMNEIKSLDENLLLNKYKFIISIEHSIYSIGFELMFDV